MKNNLTQTSMDISSYALYNTSNYRQTIDYSVATILTKFVFVIVEYMRYISEKITMKNKPHYKFIFERGFETIVHTFFTIFYYTKNLDLTFYHSQKAYYFYIEYIEQISDDNITFLQLSSRDAILFVYKKTIFEINNEYRKNTVEPSQEEKLILSLLENYSHIYKVIVQTILNNRNFKYETKKTYIHDCCDKIIRLNETINKAKIKPNYVESIYMLTNLLANKQIELDLFFHLVTNFAKKISSKKKIDNKHIKQKLYDTELANLIEHSDVDKIIDYLFDD
jgi:hypothetical protein